MVVVSNFKYQILSNLFGVTFASALSLSLWDDPARSEELALASWNVTNVWAESVVM